MGGGRGVPQEPGLDEDELPRGLRRLRADRRAGGALSSSPQQRTWHTNLFAASRWDGSDACHAWQKQWLKGSLGKNILPPS